MKELSKIIQNLPQSGIRKLQDAAREIPDAIRLETGEPNFKTPDYICEAAAQAMKDGFTKYTAVPGIKTLRDVIAEDFGKRLGIDINANQVVVTGGGTMALEIVLGCIGNPGDEILVPDPSWPVYTMQVLSNGLTAVPYVMPTDNGFEPKRENIEPLITDKTKAIMVNTPSNPTGAVFSEETVKMILELAVKYDLYVISDEMYDFLTYEGKHYSLKAMDPDGRVVLISGASKKYAMTGWRIGYAIASEKITSLMNQLMVATIGNATAVAQKAVEAAITGPQDFVEFSIKDYKARRDAAVKIFEEEQVGFYYPHGAFYIMVDVACCHMDSEEFALKLLAEEHVAVAPGGTFGESSRQMIRISYGTEMGALCEGIRRMCRFIKKYSEIINGFAEQLGVEVKWETLEWSAMLTAVNSGKVDMIAANMNMTLERASQIVFSDPYFVDHGKGCVTTDSDYQSLDDLQEAGIKFGVTEGSAYEELIPELFPESETVTLAAGTWQDALQSGIIDVAFDDGVVFAGPLATNENIRLLDGNGPSYLNGCAFAAGNYVTCDVFNLYLKRLKVSGEYADIYAQYMGTEWVPETGAASY